jgi:ribosomal protein S18 acetylase RimI-like enzyme
MLPVTGQEAQASARQARDRYFVRPAVERDLDAIADFEVDIARVSFGDEAITDAAFHRRRVAGALGKAGEITLVAVAADAADVPLGWAWMSARTNSLTGERYGNFRSLAVASLDELTGAGAETSPRLGEQLMAAILRAADEAGLTHLSGKVNAANLGMRSLYRAFGFSATHLTMEKRTPRDGRS